MAYRSLSIELVGRSVVKDDARSRKPIVKKLPVPVDQRPEQTHAEQEGRPGERVAPYGSPQSDRLTVFTDHP